jgi:hypothetical protein
LKNIFHVKLHFYPAEFADFIETVEKRGMGAMEMVAMEMKRKGMFMARQLSFSGAEYKVEEIIILGMAEFDACVARFMKVIIRNLATHRPCRESPKKTKTKFCILIFSP